MRAGRTAFVAVIGSVGLTVSAGHADSPSGVAAADGELVEESFCSISDVLPSQVSVVVEFIEAERSQLNEWLLENRLESDGTVLRRWLQEKVREGEARVIETTAISARSGQRAKVESVSEFSYPIDYDAEYPRDPETGAEILPPEHLRNLRVYESRNVGMTLEVDPVLGPDGRTVDVQFESESVALAAYSTWPRGDFDPRELERTPDFYTMELSSAVVVVDGHYVLIGTLRPRKAIQEGVDDPIVVGFVRADVSRGRRQ